MTGVLDGELIGLTGNNERDLASAVAPATALMNLDVEFTAALDREIPVNLIAGVHPETDRVLVRLVFVLNLHAVDGGVSRVQQDGAVERLANRLTLRGRPEDHRTNDRCVTFEPKLNLLLAGGGEVNLA